MIKYRTQIIEAEDPKTPTKLSKPIKNYNWTTKGFESQNSWLHTTIRYYQKIYSSKTMFTLWN